MSAMSNFGESAFEWMIPGASLTRRKIPLLMGILNVTPDSFSDGGRFAAIDAAVEHGRLLVDQGADILDIGGESTRPGAAPVDASEELRRTIPVIRQLAPSIDVPISIDTTKADVAEQAVAAGARIVNDVSGLTFDSRMVDVCRETQTGICMMHIVGTPQTMQNDPHYDDVVTEVIDFLRRSMDRCDAAGIAPETICVDPGIGFGKTADHNLSLMMALDRFHIALKRPVLVGHSRKRFLSKLLGRDVEERLAGTLGVSIGLAQRGADILRVHDVSAVRDALLAWCAVAPE